MGSPTDNFYNDAYRRGGFADEARDVQRLWLEGKRDEAIAAVPDAMVLETSFLGSVDQVTEQVRAYRDAGVTVLRVAPEGGDVQSRLDAVGQMVDIVRAVSEETGQT